MYQKERKQAITSALRNTEYDSLNEAAQCRDDEGEWIDEDDDEAKTRRISAARKKRLQLRRRVVQTLWDGEPEDVKAKFRQLAKKPVVQSGEGEKSSEGEEGESERTPEEYQM